MARLTPAEFHQVVLGTEPTAQQLRLYHLYPNYRGFSSRAQDSQMAEAVLVLALKSGAESERVLVLTTAAQEEWLLAQCEAMAMTSFEGCKKYGTRFQEFIHGYTALFKKLVMTGRVLQLREEPQHWVSFGFTVEDILPTWMLNRLLCNPSIGGSERGSTDVDRPPRDGADSE